MRRRTFLSTSAAAGLGVFSWGGRTVQAKAGDIPKRTFGKTGERLTIIGQAGGRFPLCSFEEAKAVTLRAYDWASTISIRAPLLGRRMEEVYGAVLPPFRKNVFLTTKSAQRTRKGAEADLELSLRALKTDHVDLWQMRQVSTQDEVEQIFAPGARSKPLKRPRKRANAASLDSRPP